MKKKPSNPVLAAGVLILTRTDPVEFLLMKHPKRWDLPKGHAEKGETSLETAIREMEEETGISPDKVSIDEDFLFEIEYPVTYKRWPDKKFTKRVSYFLGFVSKKPKLQLTEHRAAKWLRWAPPHDIQAATINPLLAAAEKHLKKQS